VRCILHLGEAEKCSQLATRNSQLATRNSQLATLAVLALCFDVHAASTPQHDELARTVSLVPEATLVTDTPDGNLQTLIGRFDIGLTRAELRDSRVVVEAVRRFVLKNDALFFRSPPTDEMALWSSNEPRTDGTVTFFDIVQSTAGIEWIDSSIVLQLDNESAHLLSISGDIRISSFSPIVVHELTRDDVAAIVDLTADYERGEARLKRGIDPFSESVVWRFEHRGGTGTLDEETQLVTASSPTDSATKHRTCAITARDLTRDSSGRVDNISTVSTTTYVANEACEGDEHFFGSNCDFKLRDMAYNQPIEQIDDAADGPGANVALDYIRDLPCTTVTPSFASTNINDMEQREAYVALKQAQRFARQKFFLPVPPQSVESIEFHTDYDTDSSVFGNASYNDFFVEMYFENGMVSPVVVWHEYGHHVANMYGDLSNLCADFIDEGDSIDEAIGAAMVATVLAVGTTSTYGAAVALGVGLADVHHDGVSIRVFGIGSCDPANPHRGARPFAQAYWEVMSNRNCSNNSCSKVQTAFINTASSLIPGRNQVVHQDEVARSLAFALSATPANTTYSSIVSFMNSRWLQVMTAPQAGALRAVFTHHGI
jgi:hypothetical protein